jgi:hypothetical protein
MSWWLAQLHYTNPLASPSGRQTRRESSSTPLVVPSNQCSKQSSKQSSGSPFLRASRSRSMPTNRATTPAALMATPTPAPVEKSSSGIRAAPHSSRSLHVTQLKLNVNVSSSSSTKSSTSERRPASCLRTPPSPHHENVRLGKEWLNSSPVSKKKAAVQDTTWHKTDGRILLPQFVLFLRFLSLFPPPPLPLSSLPTFYRLGKRWIEVEEKDKDQYKSKDKRLAWMEMQTNFQRPVEYPHNFNINIRISYMNIILLCTFI